jgi:16S rRNA (guanine1207-N2)-methyltransferase
MSGAPPLDVYFKKAIPFTYAGRALTFRVAQDLFSSHDIDLGTRLLLRTLADRAGGWRRILDLGCGYGPIGLALRAAHPAAEVHLVDRDALAVAYTRQNACLNGLADVEVYGSLGYDDLRRADFDLIASNIPAKAGERAIAHFLRDAAHLLAPDGMVAVVVIAALEPFVAAVLAETPGAEVLLRRARAGHTVFHYRFAGGPPLPPAPSWCPTGAREPPPWSGLARGVYRSAPIAVDLAGRACRLETAHGLPEFDAPSYTTALLLEGLEGLPAGTVRRALVFHPGQGYVPVAVWRRFAPAVVELVDRDLLALRYARRNLVANGCPDERVAPAHTVGIPPGAAAVDLIAGVLSRDEGPAAIAWAMTEAAARLTPGGWMAVAGTSTAITRLADVAAVRAALRVRERRRRAGLSLLVLRARGEGA